MREGNTAGFAASEVSFHLTGLMKGSNTSFLLGRRNRFLLHNKKPQHLSFLNNFTRLRPREALSSSAISVTYYKSDSISLPASGRGKDSKFAVGASYRKISSHTASSSLRPECFDLLIINKRCHPISSEKHVDLEVKPAQM